mmetsp:Transcript_13020/g.54545  ORF Transcript_13020/g.54545 Transcript_13020/m.54545 type:complete len:202 (-) Transcript_13020:1474-2079(-)
MRSLLEPGWPVSASSPGRRTKYAGMRWPHHSWREMHQSRMFSSQPNHVRSCICGMISSRPSRTASQASAAICLQSTHHCGLIMGSITSLEREHRPRRILLSFTPRYRPASSSAASTVLRASKRGWPANLLPPLALMRPSSVRMEMNSSLWRLPVSKSLGSCAGVILTAPVPKAMSTSSASQMTGISRSTKGWRSDLPCSAL